ncbi:hypothetical protein L596_026950 [Steinernema carpocapsae]|uniref:Metalloendopeptidase n=1 Tax=Steinernema carpocapsae TaxID=34508 RepID=A0A4U5M2X6_STECR|nr:hypothetical protein L596_026950 [Steinernema carpocapsae]
MEAQKEVASVLWDESTSQGTPGVNLCLLDIKGSLWELAFGIIIHEIGHALGFFHEHSRADRNGYIGVNTVNVDPFKVTNFDIQDANKNYNFGLPYDYGSIMQYGQYDFAWNRNYPAIYPTAGHQNYVNTMGQRFGPSFLDVLMMNKFYECLDRCKNSQIVCKNKGFNNPKNCAKCICPSGFGGQDCSVRDPGNNLGSICGSDLKAADHWQDFQYTVGSQNYWPRRDFHAYCHWHITASKGQKVQIYVHHVSGQCDNDGCFMNNVEFKMQEDLRNTGYRFCCNQQVANKSFTSAAELAILSAYARNQQYLQISYKIA